MASIVFANSLGAKTIECNKIYQRTEKQHNFIMEPSQRMGSSILQKRRPTTSYASSCVLVAPSQTPRQLTTSRSSQDIEVV